MSRPRTKQIVIALCTTVATLAVAIVAARAYFPEKALRKYKTVESTRLHHVSPPDARMYAGDYEGHKVIVRTNEDGLRTKYTADEFRRYKDRIVFLGDSFVFGLGVDQEQALAEVTEAKLRAELRRNDIAVLNAGVSSYSPFLEDLLFTDTIRAYEPTLVMLFLDVTDIGDDIIYERESSTKDGEVYFEPPDAKNYSYYKFELTVDGVLETNRFFIYRHPLDVTRPYFERTMSHVDRIAAKVAQSGAKFALVVFPRFQHWNKEECPKNWERRSYKLDEPYQFEFFRFFAEAKATREYEVIDLLPAFQETKEFPLVFTRDPHWNASGHAFVAGVVAQRLIDAYVR